MYIHNNYDKVKADTLGSCVSHVCVLQGPGELPRRAAMSQGTEHQYFRITLLWCVRGSAPLLPCIPAVTCIPCLTPMRLSTCVPAKLVQHLERISVPLPLPPTAPSGPKGDRARGQLGHVSSFLSSKSVPTNTAL